MQQRRQAVTRPFKPGFIVPDAEAGAPGFEAPAAVLHDTRKQGPTDLRSIVSCIDMSGPRDPTRRYRLEVRNRRHTGAMIRGPACRPES
jgi:hypothetical protein